MKTVVLENVRSAHNVGSIFRTADGAGVGRIFLVGYTPTPIDRFGRVQTEIEKTSLGATQTVPWEHADDIASVLSRLQEQSTVVAVEQDIRALPLSRFTTPENVSYVFGNEVDGVTPDALACCEQVVEIPMLGQKESLNVSVAAGIILYHGLGS